MATRPVMNVPTEKKPRRSARKWLFDLLKFAVSGGLLFVILRNANWVEIRTAVAQANWWLLLVALLMHPVGFIISAFRWRMLLRTRGSDTSIRFLVESYIVGMFFNNLLPSTIGGDAYRAYDSYRLGQSKSSAFAVVFVDRFLGLLVLMLFALLALLNSNELTAQIPYLLLWVGLGSLGMSAFVWLVFAPPRWLPGLIGRLKLPFGRKIHHIIDAFFAFQGHRAVLFRALGLSVLLQLNVIVHYFIIAQALSLPIPLWSFFLIIPLATVITLLPITVNGIGLREGLYVFFFAPFGVSTSLALAFSVIGYGIVLLQGVIGGVVYALRK